MCVDVCVQCVCMCVLFLLSPGSSLLFSDYPFLHSGILSALGNFLAQLIEKKQKKENCSQKLDVSGPLRYAIYG